MALEDIQNLNSVAVAARQIAHSAPVGILNAKEEEEFIDRHL